METITALLITLVFATLFTIFQGYEYINAPFHISDGIYGSTFYMLTGLHGMHVIVGTIFLTVALYRAVAHHYTTHNHIGYECAA
jgi:heme/copper-type cytochrome/quinol oxidase subunit 3